MDLSLSFLIQDIFQQMVNYVCMQVDHSAFWNMAFVMPCDFIYVQFSMLFQIRKKCCFIRSSNHLLVKKLLLN